MSFRIALRPAASAVSSVMPEPAKKSTNAHLVGISACGFKVDLRIELLTKTVGDLRKTITTPPHQ
jgi:hypothetical protein